MTGELERWHDFYVLIGSAGATLLGLLFIAVSLGAGFLTEEKAAATRTFYSPIIIHFTCVLFISAIALVPAYRAMFFAAIIGSAAVAGAAISAFITVELLRRDWTRYVRDDLAYGLLPAIGYLALLAAATMIFKQSEYAPDVLAGAVLLLLIINIRNTWDLMLSMVRHSGSR
jgi:hypothetical protein